MKRISCSLAVFAAMFALPILLIASTTTSEDKPGFFRYPHTDGAKVVFTCEGDLWLAPLAGGVAVRLTTHEGEERFARFSPDGRMIAFTGQDDAQDDVYIMASEGGEPRRLTFHPDRDQVVGWKPDGKLLFRSTRDIPYRGYRIYELSPEGGMPVSIGLDKGALISYEPNGSRIAFNRYSREFRNWKRYKGGWAQDIWVGDMKRLEFANLTKQKDINYWDGTDAFPMWHADGRIYFLSDRAGRANLFSMRPDGRDLKQHTSHSAFDVRWPSLGGGVIVYQNGMDIWAFEISTGKSRQVSIQLPSDRVQARVKFVNPRDYITDFQLSPDAKRLLLCARGDLFTVPAKGEGLIRSLSFDSAVRDKFPRWSPDGAWVFHWSDAGGEETLYKTSAEGGAPMVIGTDKRGWHYPPLPSPDGNMIAFSNEELEMVVMDAKTGQSRVIDSGGWEITDYTWSPDSRYLAYSRPEPNGNNVIRVWDARAAQAQSVTNNFYNSYSPAWDPKGKLLFFLSDRTANPHLDWREGTYILDRRARPYLVTLLKETPSPFAPMADPKVEEDKPWEKWGKGDGEKALEKDKKGKKDPAVEAVSVQIDWDGLDSRLVMVPVEPGNYFGLSAVEGKLFFLSRENRGMLGSELFEEPRGAKLHRFDIAKRKAKLIAEEVRGYDVSYDGKKIVIYQKGQFLVKGVDEDGGGEWRKDSEGKEEEAVKLDGWSMRVDVRAEWRQMFQEAWRLQRDFFWEPKLHQVNWRGVYDQYALLAARISTREELGDLIGEMFAELNCSHTYVWGGDQRRPQPHPTGLLGADLSRTSEGFYRIDSIIVARTWERELISPLAEPGVKASKGNYIVAVNGKPTNAAASVYELLLDRADKVTALTLNTKPSLEGGWEVVVKPLASERELRYYAWVEGRRAYVSSRSGGRIGYIHLSDMGSDGLSQFTGTFFPQHDKQALIMDVRYNGGGFVAEMILSHLGRKLFAVGRPRHGATYRSPTAAFYGHMAAVCNGETGSDGETFTEGFKRTGLGKVIGTRTWGGWVGIRGDKPLVDRGMVTQPEFTGWGLDGKYLIEGWGTEPDIVIEEDPTASLRGTDPQLDYTIKHLLELLTQRPMPIPAPPAAPDRSK